MEPLNIDKVREKLNSLGIEGEKQEEVLKDLSRMIMMKIMIKQLSNLNPEQQDMLKSIPENELANYLEQNKDQFPKIPAEKIEQIGNEVLEGYFKEMEK